MSERLSIGSHRFTSVYVMDKPGAGGACHKYFIDKAELEEEDQPRDRYGFVAFQSGPVKENGVNGCHQEDLLAIVIHRLRSFQAGLLACHENAQALTNLEKAMHWLNHRTADRQNRGVAGTNTL